MSQPSAERHANGDEGWAEKTLKTLSIEEKVGQLFMIRMRVEFLHGQSLDYVQLRDNIRKYHIGSLAMSVPAQGRARDVNRRLETVTLLNQLQQESNLPLLIAGDFE
ncbi:MAG: hypothetical protein ACM3ND_06725, partial [Acidobacteriota bacterium]